MYFKKDFVTTAQEKNQWLLAMCAAKAFEHLLINTPLVHFVWKMILNQRSADEPCYIWAPINQYPTCAFCVENDFESTFSRWTRWHLSTKSIHNTSLSPSSALTSGVSLSSLLTSPREFGSCKLCGQDFSIDSWLKMHIISKYQSNSQDLALSFFLVLWSLFSILRHLRGVWIGDLWKET